MKIGFGDSNWKIFLVTFYSVFWLKIMEKLFFYNDHFDFIVTLNIRYDWL